MCEQGMSGDDASLSVARYRDRLTAALWVGVRCRRRARRQLEHRGPTLRHGGAASRRGMADSPHRRSAVLAGGDRRRPSCRRAGAMAAREFQPCARCGVSSCPRPSRTCLRDETACRRGDICQCAGRRRGPAAARYDTAPGETPPWRAPQHRCEKYADLQMPGVQTRTQGRADRGAQRTHQPQWRARKSADWPIRRFPVRHYFGET